MSFPYPVNSSGQQSASAQITSLRSFLAGIDVIPPTSGIATLVIYDSENSTLSGKTILAEVIVDAGMPSCNHEFFAFVSANRGIYAQLTDPSASSTFIVRFALG